MVTNPKRWASWITMVFVASAPLLAAPFTNGDFEVSSGAASITGGFIRCWSNGTCGPGAPPPAGGITGWIIISEVDYYAYHPSYPASWQAQSGTHSVDLNGYAVQQGGVRQTFDTISNQLYLLTFYLSGNFDLSEGGQPSVDPKTVTVSVAGVDQNFQFFMPVGWSHTNMGWVQRTLSFTATGSATTLSFTAGEHGGYGPVIDNVSFAAIPEPASMLLLGAGIFALAGFARFRRKR